MASPKPIANHDWVFALGNTNMTALLTEKPKEEEPVVKEDNLKEESKENFGKEGFKDKAGQDALEDSDGYNIRIPPPQSL